MGGATVEGILKCPDTNPSDITVADPNEAAIKQFANTGVNITTDNAAAVKDADIVFVVVKPWLVEKVLGGIKDTLDLKEQVIVVVAAGVPSESIKLWLDKGDGVTPRLFLAIPNTAIAVRESMTFLVPAGATD